MTNEARPPTEILKEVISFVRPNAANENSQSKIRSQVLRGVDQRSGLACHEFKRDGEFGASIPCISKSEDISSVILANTRVPELDINICKMEWYKSTINWPFSHLFENFHQGFLDAKIDSINKDLIVVIKGINFVEDYGISQKLWEVYAYSEGTKFGRRYIADRQEAHAVTKKLSLRRLLTHRFNQNQT